MPFKTRYHTSKRWRFVILSFFCANAQNKFTQKFILAISLRVCTFVWRNSVNKATSRFVFFTVSWFSCSSINVSMQPSKEANLELTMLDSRVGVNFVGCNCALLNFRHSRLWLGGKKFFHRSRFPLANGFSVLVLRYRFSWENRSTCDIIVVIREWKKKINMLSFPCAHSRWLFLFGDEVFQLCELLWFFTLVAGFFTPLLSFYRCAVSEPWQQK